MKNRFSQFIGCSYKKPFYNLSYLIIKQPLTCFLVIILQFVFFLVFFAGEEVKNWKTPFRFFLFNFMKNDYFFNLGK